MDLETGLDVENELEIESGIRKHPCRSACLLFLFCFVGLLLVISVVVAASATLLCLWLLIGPCCLYYWFHAINYYGLDEFPTPKESTNTQLPSQLTQFSTFPFSSSQSSESPSSSPIGKLSSNPIISTSTLRKKFRNFVHSFRSQQRLFNYENTTTFYHVFVYFPVHSFNLLCSYFHPDTVKTFLFSISLISCLIMVFVTYLAEFWVCIFLIWLFDHVGDEFEFSTSEQCFAVVASGIPLFLFISFVPAGLYLVWSLEIAALFSMMNKNRLPQYTGRHKFNDLGVTFAFIEEFIELNGGRDAFLGLTTAEVAKRFVQPQSQLLGISYSEMCWKEGNTQVQKATAFISHVWDYRFLDVIDILKDHFRKETETVSIWFDLFSKNQNEMNDDIAIEWFCGTLKHSVQSIGRTVVVLPSLEKPLAFTQTCCLWEILISQITNVQFEIAMKPKEELRFYEMIANDPDTFHGIIAPIEIQQSTARNPADKVQLFKVIESTIGFLQVNEKIFQIILSQFLSRLKLFIAHDVPSTSEPQSALRLRVFRGLCLIVRDLGDYDSAIAFCRMYLMEVLQRSNGNSVDLSVRLEAYQMFASLCLNCGYTRAAVDCIRTMQHSQTHSNSFNPVEFNSKRLLGIAFKQLRDFDSARMILEGCVRQLRDLSSYDLQCVLAFVDLAELYYESQANLIEEAIDLCKEAASVLLHHGCTITHPYLLEVNMKKAYFSRSIDDLKRNLLRTEDRYGLLHPRTIACMGYLNELIIDPHEGRSNALLCYEASLLVFKQNTDHPVVHKAKYYVDRYTANVPRLCSLWILSIICYGLSLYYSYDMLQHRQNEGIVRQDLILTGFCYVFSLVMYLGMFVYAHLQQDPDIQQLPLFYLNLRSFLDVITLSMLLVPWIFSFHGFVEDPGYWFAGACPAMVSGYVMLFTLYKWYSKIIIKFWKRNSIKAELKAKAKLQNMVFDDNVVVLENQLPLEFSSIHTVSIY